MTLEVIFTCEHGGNEIPRFYREYFGDARNVLETHRGWDPGTLPLARELAKAFHAKLFFSTTSRLLVDLNRSKGHPRQFSEFSRRMSRVEQESVIDAFYKPYRSQVTEAVESRTSKGKTVLHVSVHSFTPLFAGKVRTTDVGLLYDPSRETEAEFAELWRKTLKQQSPVQLTIHHNRPYRGTSDGFTTFLRTQYASERYLGIELELSQKHLTSRRRFPRNLERLIVESLKTAIQRG